MFKNKILQLSLIILAGEAIFILPFVIVRIFRPTFLNVFNLSNTELGNCYALYGFSALISYLLGGLIADKFDVRKLMSVAMILTALGGIVMLLTPSVYLLYGLYIYWGITTILLFWAAMIKITRLWGGGDNQGKAFGFLEGGRGMVAALFASAGVLIFNWVIPEQQGDSKEVLTEAMHLVYLLASIMIVIIGILLLFLPKQQLTDEDEITNLPSLNLFKQAIKIPVVWQLMLIILTGYIGYKTADVFTLYVKEMYQYSDTKAATLGMFFLYLRPIVCVLIGLFANTSSASKWLVISFIIMSVGSILLWLNVQWFSIELLYLFSLFSAATGVYAIRTLYFAVLEEAKIPIIITGTVVGILSIIGYTPDIFMGPLIGYFLDTIGGENGYSYLFLFFALSSFIGLLISIQFNKKIKRDV